MKNSIKNFSLIFAVFSLTPVFAHSNHESHTHVTELGLIALVSVVAGYLFYRLISSHLSFNANKNHKVTDQRST